MNKILYIFLFVFSLSISSIAQDDSNGSKVKERMTEYIQKRLNLSKGEAERFTPVFTDYFNALRKTNQEFSGDRLILQQKIVELRLNYRNQFRDLLGEKRGNDVFNLERDFIDEVKRLRIERSSREK